MSHLRGDTLHLAYQKTDHSCALINQCTKTSKFEMSQYANSSLPEFPSDLIEVVQNAHEEAAGECATEEPCVFVLAHERMPSNAESEFIIEGVFSTLDSANQKTMELFKENYTGYQRSDFYAQGT
jgi:hypothetical protein